MFESQLSNITFMENGREEIWLFLWLKKDICQLLAKVYAQITD